MTEAPGVGRIALGMEQPKRESGRAHGDRGNVTVMGKRSNLPLYQGENEALTPKPPKEGSRQHSGSQQRLNEKPKRPVNTELSASSSSVAKGKCNPRVKADRKNPPGAPHSQQGVDVLAPSGPKQQQQVAKDEAESTTDTICAQESLTMPPLSLATPSPANGRSVPVHHQPHPTHQPFPGSPAKRGVPECGSIGGLSEKRSRTRGPSKEDEQAGAPSGPAQGEASPAKSGRPSRSNSDVQPSSAAPHNQGSSNLSPCEAQELEHVQGSRRPQSPSTPVAGPRPHSHLDFLAAEEGKGTEQNRRVPRLNLDRLPTWAAHGSAGRPPGLHRPLNQAAQGSTPSPVPSPVQQGETEGEGSEDEELASWMHEPQWVPDSEGKGHVFKPVSRKELRHYQALISELHPHQAQQVTQLWESLHEARQSCEQMTSRGVRAAKDVTAGWAAHVSDLVDRSDRFEKQVRELMLLTQHQADAIEALQVELAGMGSSTASYGAAHTSASPAAGTSARQTHTSPSKHRPSSPEKSNDKSGWDRMEGSSAGGRGGQQDWSDGAARVLQQELEASALENAKLASTNAELVQSLDSMSLLFSGAQAEVARLSTQLARSQEQSASLERQLAALRKLQQFEQHRGNTHHRYSQPAGTQASKPFAAQAFTSAGRASNSASRWPEQLHYRHTPGYMDHTSFRSSLGPDHVGLRSTALGNEYKRAAFRALLNRGGVV